MSEKNLAGIRLDLIRATDQQTLYELLIAVKNEWNRRYETHENPQMKKAYLNFRVPQNGAMDLRR